jgi:hypothetical protein
MKQLAFSLIALCLFAGPACAYSTKKDDGAVCNKDGTACDVYCDNGDFAGWMYWDGNSWTDGVRSADDLDTEAREICAAHSQTCT